jgi:hypothetical protein
MRTPPRATRPVFTPAEDRNKLFQSTNITFDWVSGMSINNWQKSVENLHREYKKLKGTDNQILEVSTKSLDGLGKLLSAFNLDIPLSDGHKIPLECAYQGSKVFKNGGPYIDLYYKEPSNAKKDKRLKESGDIIGFKLESESFPISPSNLFYDWLYILALRNSNLIDTLDKFEAFTDIVFNPKKSINTQARSVAIAKTLYNRNKFFNISIQEFQTFFEDLDEKDSQFLLF